MTPAAAIESLGLSVDSVFVPFSQSRNKDEKHKSLNWRITLKCNGRAFYSCDYSAGIGHAPSYGKKAPAAWDRPARLWPEMAGAFEAESGFALGPFFSWSGFRADKSKPIKPDPVNVILCLFTDSSVLDSGGFEAWAADMGLDPDSRKAESTYRACLETALALRGAIGERGFSVLSEAFTDY